MTSIFYAEDSHADILLFKRHFERHFEQVELIIKETGDAALNFLTSSSEKEPSLIILDENMPGLKGTEILKELRKLSYNKSIPIVIYTTAQLPPDEMRELQSLSAHYLRKPFQLDGYEVVMEKLKEIIKC